MSSAISRRYKTPVHSCLQIRVSATRGVLQMTALRLLILSLSACFAAAILVEGGVSADGPATFAAGEEAYVALKFDDARRLYAAAAASAATPKERASSLRQLGVMAWRLAQRNDEAQRYFDQALAVGDDLTPTYA